MNQEKVWDDLAEQWHNFRQLKFRPVYDFIEKYQPKKGKNPAIEKIKKQLERFDKIVNVNILMKPYTSQTQRSDCRLIMNSSSTKLQLNMVCFT